MRVRFGFRGRVPSRVVAASLSVLVLSGCAVTPAPFTEAEIKAVVEADRSAIESAVTAVTGPVTLEEAVARALKHNLDYRTRLMEQSLAAGQLQAGQYDMLPRLLTNAGYSWRDKESVRNSVDSVTGKAQETNPSISSERSRPTWDIGLSWSVLDFGVSYFNAKQNADRLLVANERRRKAMHNLIQNVRTTYWRALAAQKLRDRVKVTIDEAEEALADSQRILSNMVRNPVEPLRYQRNLLENLRLLENVERELASSEIELATLMGLRSGTRIQLVEPELAGFKSLESGIERMEEIALLNNADLREQFYNARIAAAETRKAMLRILPNLSFDYGYKFDGDKYLINQTWQEAGAKVSMNLFNLISGPAQIRAAEMDVQVAESRRMALQMAVLSQVHLARYQYDDSLQQYQRAVSIHDVDHQLAEIATSAERSQMGNKLERISANVTSILSAIRLYHAIAKVNEATSRVQASLGLEPEIDSLDQVPLEDLTQMIGAILRESL